MRESSSARQALAENFLRETYRDHRVTNYPERLIRHLAERFGIQPGQTLLDVGCGRGEFLHGFSILGISAIGIDQTDSANLSREENYVSADISEGLPFPDETFDFVFNKSVLEHFYFPENLVLEMHRVLKEGGMVISMTPSWVHNQAGFFVDFTHRTPFTRESLGDIHRISGFENVSTEYFTQLPAVWRAKYLRIVTFIVRYLVPRYFSRSSKFVRFSKELMLLSTASKPRKERA